MQNTAKQNYPGSNGWIG